MPKSRDITTFHFKLPPLPDIPEFTQVAKSTSQHYDFLRDRWVRKHRKLQKQFWSKHKDHLEGIQEAPRKVAVGSLAGLMMLSQPVPATLIAQTFQQSANHNEQAPDVKEQLIKELSAILPEKVQPLSDEQEAQIAEILSSRYNMDVKPSLEGKRLNRTYGLIGAEQHLMRYPGDTMATHFDNAADADKYYSSGMAPGRGAWGYFAYSAAAMTEKDVMREKYYIAVQTFLAPGWHDDVNGHYKFFRYRKMLVVNPENGKAVVADIGDAGPAPFTGKHLGGSPEVMKHLERVDGRAKGPVLYFFIDDPADVIQLGPIEVQ